ncbi:PfkB family carbohydrate kinase [Paracoccus lutimaris]|uniref:Sugar/nucleoside kinase (Ribokinase family) n=1 Tax=Paracoccus lutimaris TaxID=1490030 RepID=A0A368Z8H8_9RHOB|nr:PfkB family carbohydrate kinase [Paracoccus lutimaris]RCW88713.1 sugar/nucleoside kinase (ribokinase family) [Paracoccus lutimaris]
MTDIPRIICAGAMLWDVIGHSPTRLNLGDDVAGRIRRFPGGVATNIGLALTRRGHRPAMLSSVGHDAPGDLLVADAMRLGLDMRWVRRDTDLPTGMYIAVESPDGLVAAIADVRALEAAGTGIFAPLRDGRLGDAATPWRGTLVLDGNLTLAVISSLARDPCLAGAALCIAPASPDKVTRLWPLLGLPEATFYLNRREAEALTGRSFRSIARAAEAVIALGARRVLVTDSANAVADALKGEATLTETPPQVAAIRVTGAGDAFVAAHIAAELTGTGRAEALTAALRAGASHVAGMEQ